MRWRDDGIMEKKRTGYKRYPSELKERAVRMALDLQRSDPWRQKCHLEGGPTTRGG